MKKINGNLWRDMLVSGSNLMLNNKARIDALNVFPVPDGDTGSNMGATCEYSTKEIVNIKDGKISEVASKFSRGMLMGARGNSGVILSQIFKGFSVGLEGKKEATTFDIVASFDQAKIYAYKSVMKPVEGTILTVIRMISEDLAKVITPANSVETLFEKAVNFAKKAVEATPDLLPVLKEVGVVDSGGEGLRLILEGMYLALIGKPVEIDPNAPQSVDQPFSSNDDFDHDGEFGYCTEMIVELKNPKLFSKEKFLKGIVKMGDSIGLVHDDDILKVHIHTLKPGHVFNFAQKFGEFIFLKSENMQLQANEKDAKTSETSNKKVKIGVVSVNIGQGIIDTAKELGANFVIAGGQSINPSAADFIDAFKKINTKNIIVLPNNSNVILAAQQAAQTVKDIKVIIIPSKTQMQGLTALMSFNEESTMTENKKEMLEMINSVKTGQVTKSSRTTKIKGVQVKEGEYLAIADKTILKSSKSKIESAIAISKKLIDDDTEVVSIYYGVEATLTDAEELSSYLETHYDIDIEIKAGRQPMYDFLISYE